MLMSGAELLLDGRLKMVHISLHLIFVFLSGILFLLFLAFLFFCFET